MILPSRLAKIHDVFHISLLYKKKWDRFFSSIITNSIRNRGRFDAEVKAKNDIRPKWKGPQKQEDPYDKSITEELTSQGIDLGKRDRNEKKISWIVCRFR